MVSKFVLKHILFWNYGQVFVGSATTAWARTSCRRCSGTTWSMTSWRKSHASFRVCVPFTVLLICARLQRCDQFMNGVSNQVHQHNKGHGHNSFSITSCMRQFGAHSLDFELCVTLSVRCAATFSSHASKSSVNHLNHWCATLRDRTSC